MTQDQLVSGRFLDFLWTSFGRPDWFFNGTSLDRSAGVPARIRVGDYLKLVGNAVTLGPDPAYHISLMDAGMPVHLPGLDLGMRYAPNLQSALELLAKHEPSRRGYDQLLLVRAGERARLEFRALVDLGAAREILVETPLLKVVRSLAPYSGGNLDRVSVEFRHGEPSYFGKLRAAFGCPIEFDAQRDAVWFPAEWLEIKNVAADPILWELACSRCDLEDRELLYSGFILELRAAMSDSLARNSRVPRAREMAEHFAMSARTLLRRLRAEGTKYQDLVDDILRSASVELLSQRGQPTSQIAEKLGFADSSSFSRSFRRWFGVNPGQYRRDRR